MSQLLACLETPFIIDDIIADESLDKRRQSLLELAISGRHCNHYLWLLTQSYSATPKILRRQTKVIFVWYPKEGADIKMIHDENHVLTDDELVIVRGLLKESKQIQSTLTTINKNDRGREENNNTREAFGARCSRSKTCSTHEKKEKKKYYVTKSSFLNSLQYSLQYSIQCSLQYSLRCSLQYSQIELIFIALVHLLSLPFAFAYFLHIKLLGLQTKPQDEKQDQPP